MQRTKLINRVLRAQKPPPGTSCWRISKRKSSGTRRRRNLDERRRSILRDASHRDRRDFDFATPPSPLARGAHDAGMLQKPPTFAPRYYESTSLQRRVRNEWDFLALRRARLCIAWPIARGSPREPSLCRYLARNRASTLEENARRGHCA